MANELQNKVFHDAEKARQWLESHLWPDGTVCGYCGTIDNATPIETRPGYFQCNSKECRSQFTVMVGTVFERSHIPLNKWLLCAFLMCSSKKGISAHQMHRMLGISYKSTWFMCHRIREAMRPAKYPGPLGGLDEIVEVDESYIGGKASNRKSRRVAKKKIVVALVHRGGDVRAFPINKVKRIENQICSAFFLRVFAGFFDAALCCGPAFAMSRTNCSKRGHASGTSSISVGFRRFGFRSDIAEILAQHSDDSYG